LVAICPHTFAPDGHELLQQRGRVPVCRLCGGVLSFCPSCRAVNRSAALFCVHCGQSIEPRRAASLLSHQEVRDNVRTAAARNVSLHAALGLESDWQPLYWTATLAGVWIFSARNGGPVRLDLIEGSHLHSARGRPLCVDLPSVDTWIAPPLVTEDGAFAITETGVDAVRSHGGEEPFERLRTRPLQLGEAICGAGIDVDGSILLALQTADGGIRILSGNGQADDWRPAIVIPGVRVEQSEGVWLGGTSVAYWLAAGGQLWIVGRTDTVVPIQSAPVPKSVARSWGRRIALGQKEALPLGDGRGGIVFFDAGADTRLIHAELDGASPREIRRLSDGWAVADEDGAVLIGQGRTIQVYANGRQRGGTAETGGPTNVAPIVTRRWLAALRPLSAVRDVVADQGAELMVFVRDDGGTPKIGAAITLQGTPVRGLPPLLVGDSIVIATRCGSRAEHRLTIATITEPAPTGGV
jgi:hypothetical protein